MVKFRFCIFVVLYLLFFKFSICISKFLLLVDENSGNLIEAFRNGLSEFNQENEGQSLDFQAVSFVNESNWEELCQVVSSGISVILDLRHQFQGEFKPREFFESRSIPYFKIELPLDTLIRGANRLMESKNSSNGFFIFHGENDVRRGIQLILGNTMIRYAFLNGITMGKLITEKLEYRIPSGILLFGHSQNFETFIKDRPTAIRNYTEWIFSFDSFHLTDLAISFPYLRGSFDVDFCCRLMGMYPESSTPQPSNGNSNCKHADCIGGPTELYLKRFAFIISETLIHLNVQSIKLNCGSNDTDKEDPQIMQSISKELQLKSQGLFRIDKERVGVSAIVIYEEIFNNTKKEIGQYTTQIGFKKSALYEFRQKPVYYRIGIVNHKPWTYWNNETGEWMGYCIDLAKKMAARMNFTYDFVLAKTFGSRHNQTGRWSGITGDLVHGKIDIAIAAYIMTSEREEYVDFVSPYFEQSGLIIAMLKPVVKNSLFKFMTVLRPEVWFSIAGATIATGLMLWFLDKFSPYSAQNNQHKYKQFRKFTLKESFWFALTSFTPQGGGEPPKALSGRMLVAAYWIFVVLMLATFTANLAAFLTVERMQSPIRNLEHLAGQSSVKYSIVEDSTAYRFFNNMATAEELLYQMWRNLTLTVPSSDKQYIVWEYPIREMYIHIKSVIEKTGFVSNYHEGLARAARDGYYAFIHDAAQTKYEVYRNCELTLIGEPFAESPYAIAVAQGNPLQDNISLTILELQTERFFEGLSTKYWTPQCVAAGEGEGDGISLESLGGVFIATLIGLGIAFISLGFEILSTVRSKRKAKIEAELIKPQFIVPMDFYASSKKFEKKLKHRDTLPTVSN